MAGRSASDTDISAWMMSSNKMVSPHDRFGLGTASSASSPDAVQTKPINPAPRIKIFSAEVPEHEATNVLKEEPHLTWRVPAGSIDSHVTLELDSPTQILGIEVVNDNSFQVKFTPFNGVLVVGDSRWAPSAKGERGEKKGGCQEGVHRAEVCVCVCGGVNMT